METSSSKAVTQMTAYEWGILGGRLARIMADSVKSALTREAISSVLDEFHKSLSGDSTTGNQIPADSLETSELGYH